MNLGFEKPEVFYDGEKEGTCSTFCIKPLEKGFGQTVGNALRRTLLTSLPGTAVIGVWVDGVLSEMQHIDGTSDDLMDVIQDLKKMRFHVENDTETPVVITFSGKENKAYYARDISLPEGVKLLTPDVPLVKCTGTKEVKMEIFLKKGRGFQEAKKIKDFDSKSGVIAIDAKYNPIVRVEHPVVDTYRIGDDADFDSVAVTLETDGSLSPKDAMMIAKDIIRSIFGFFDAAEHVDHQIEIYKREIEERNQLLDQEIEQLGLSVRSSKRLKDNDVHKVRDLVQLTEGDITAYQQIGKVSKKEILDTIKELKEKLKID